MSLAIRLATSDATVVATWGRCAGKVGRISETGAVRVLAEPEGPQIARAELAVAHISRGAARAVQATAANGFERAHSLRRELAKGCRAFVRIERRRIVQALGS